MRDVCMQEGSSDASGYSWTHVTRWRDEHLHYGNQVEMIA